MWCLRQDYASRSHTETETGLTQAAQGTATGCDLLKVKPDHISLNRLLMGQQSRDHIPVGKDVHDSICKTLHSCLQYSNIELESASNSSQNKQKKTCIITTI